MILDQIWHELRVRTQPVYHLLGSPNGSDRPATTSAYLRQIIPRTRRHFLILLGVLFVILSASIVGRSPQKELESLKALGKAVQPSAGYLHVLISSGDANTRFCRSSLSSTILGYPYPQVLNWDGRSNEDGFPREGAWEYGKLRGALDYLKTLDDWRKEDIVVIADSEDSWFQLKPEVLIKRFQEITRQAERRLAQTTKHSSPTPKRPTIVFAARKKCHGDKDHIGCHAAPAPPAFKTLTIPSDKYEEAQSDVRPRFLSSAVIVGTATSLQTLLEKAVERWKGNPTHFKNRDDIFATFFGEQEFQRSQITNPSNPSFLSRLFSIFSGSNSSPPNPPNNHPPPNAVVYASSPTACDFGLTLDYKSLISLSTDSQTGAWVTFTNTSSFTTAAESLSLSSLPSYTLDQDIYQSRPPLWSLAPFSIAYPFLYEDLPRHLKWLDLPLYTNLATSTTPAILSHRHATLNEETLMTRWSRMWWHPHTRKKLFNIAFEPVIPLATTPNDDAIALAASTASSAQVITLSRTLRDRIAAYQRRLNLGAVRIPHPAFSQVSQNAGNSKYNRQRPLAEKQWWNYIDPSPANKHREGIGFSIDINDKEWGGWKKWGEECDAGFQEELIGDKGGKWVDPKVYAPFPDLDHDDV